MALEVLLISSDSEHSQIILTLMSHFGARTFVAKNVDESIQISYSKPVPDLMILDLDNSRSDESEIRFLRELRSKLTYDKMPILVLTTMIDSPKIKQALDAGADRYLTKPYLSRNLIGTVQQMMRSGRQARTAQMLKSAL